MLNLRAWLLICRVIEQYLCYYKEKQNERWLKHCRKVILWMHLHMILSFISIGTSCQKYWSMQYVLHWAIHWTPLVQDLQWWQLWQYFTLKKWRWVYPSCFSHWLYSTIYEHAWCCIFLRLLCIWFKERTLAKKSRYLFLYAKYLNVSCLSPSGFSFLLLVWFMISYISL